jgi:D-alanyl-D-alanine carboxypeptidase
MIMKRGFIFTLIWIFSFLLFLGCSDDSEELIPTGPTMEQRLQKIIDEKVGNDTDKLVGVSVSIRVGNEERWKLVGGISKLAVPSESNMRFGIGSITKTAVAATILKLEDEGLLSLDDTIGDWLSLNLPNIDESITIFQLLAHFTGLKGYFKHPDIWRDVEGNLGTAIEPTRLAGYIGTPINTPGITHEYSNSNYLVLGLIIEAVTQKTVGEVMREKFWIPLQMNNIYFSSNEPVTGNIATPWRDSDGDGTLEDISDEFKAAYHSVFYCAAGIFSTASV